jgi:NADH:ubiquinone reductase (H+-translocating)
MTHRVLIVGGGFGGLYAAKALRRAPVEVTLVDRSNHHLFQPLLYQVAAGILTEGEIAPPLRGVLRRQDNARVLLAEVDDFDLDERTVSATAPGGAPLTLGYDSLIVAAGAGGGLKTLADAREIRSRVLRAFELAELATDPRERAAWLRFAVVGGGPTGIELAGQIAALAQTTLRPDYREIDTRLARISLLEAGPRVLPEFPEQLRLRAARELAELGVDVWLRAGVVGADDEGVDLAGGLRVPARTVIWAAGVKASPLAETLAFASGAGLDRHGRIGIEDDLSLPGHPEVFAIGDMAKLDGVPGVAPAAIQEGRHAARTIRRRLADKPAARPFRYVDKGQLAVIGRRRALGSAFGIRFAGRIALLIWAVVHVRYMIGWGNRLVTVTRWLWTMLARDRGQRVISPTPLTDLSKTVRTTERVTI